MADGAPRPDGKLSLLGPVTVASVERSMDGSVREDVRAARGKTTKTISRSSSASGTSGAVARRLDGARVRVPDLGLAARHAEARLELLTPIGQIGEVIDVGRGITPIESSTSASDRPQTTLPLPT